jgi:Ca-activated chloride channel family protein
MNHFKLKVIHPFLLCLTLIAACAAPVNNVVAKAGPPLQIRATSEIKLLEDAKILEACVNKTNVHYTIDYSGSVELRDNLDREQAKSLLVPRPQSEAQVYMVASPMWATHSVLKEKTSFMKSIPVILVSPELQKANGWNTQTGITIEQLVEAAKAIEVKKLQFAGPSGSQDDNGANMLLAFIAGLRKDQSYPLVESDFLEGSDVFTKMQTLYSAMRLTGSNASRVRDLVLKDQLGDKTVNAAFLPEALALSLNRDLVANKLSPWSIYYVRGAVSLQNYTIGYIDGIPREQIDQYTKFVDCLMDPAIQSMIEKQGFRTSVVGITMLQGDRSVFNPLWGANITTEFPLQLLPKAPVIQKVLELYQRLIRPGSFTVWCLDKSGSMLSDGNKQLLEAMQAMLLQDKAVKHLLHASPKDTTYIVPFTDVISDFNEVRVDGNDEVRLAEAYAKLASIPASGGTNIYGCAIRANALIQLARPDQISAIILMTDGDHRESTTIEDYKKSYNQGARKAPIYSVMFASAKKTELDAMANHSSGEVCDGRGGELAFIRCFKLFKGNN